MSRPALILVAIVVAVVVAAVLLSSIDTPVAPAPVTKPVANEALAQ